jgi:hypothetical protein
MCFLVGGGVLLLALFVDIILDDLVGPKRWPRPASGRIGSSNLRKANGIDL